MRQYILIIVIGVAVVISTALIMSAIGFSEFSQGLCAGIFATIVQRITGDYLEELEGK